MSPVRRIVSVSHADRVFVYMGWIARCLCVLTVVDVCWLGYGVAGGRGGGGGGRVGLLSASNTANVLVTDTL